MKKLIIASLIVFCVGVVAEADWVPADGHKMHWAQPPDPFGWDINATDFLLADDWQCSQTGPVNDIHLWGSWQDGVVGNITNIHVSIHKDIKATADHWSMPGELLREWNFGPTDFTYRPDPMTDVQQGWMDPGGNWNHPDHFSFHQINITKILNPFKQTKGEIYWLDIKVTLEPGTNAKWGWKTTPEPFDFMDDAVYLDSAGNWIEIWDPRTNIPPHSLDMAFVITPEPATVFLLGLGGLALFRRRKRV